MRKQVVLFKDQGVNTVEPWLVGWCEIWVVQDEATLQTRHKYQTVHCLLFVWRIRIRFNYIVTNVTTRNTADMSQILCQILLRLMRLCLFRPILPHFTPAASIFVSPDSDSRRYSLSTFCLSPLA